MQQYLLPALISAFTALIVVLLNNKLQKRNALLIEHQKEILSSQRKKVEDLSEGKKEISGVLQKAKNILTLLCSDYITNEDLESFDLQFREISQNLHHLYGMNKGVLDVIDNKIIHDSLKVVDHIKHTIIMKRRGNFSDQYEYQSRLFDFRNQLNHMQNQIFFHPKNRPVSDN